MALTIYNGPTLDVTEVAKPRGRISFKVDVNPPNSYVDVYFRSLDDYLTKMYFENDHVSVARRHEQAIQDFKKALEAICDCPDQAREAKTLEEVRLMRKVNELKAENDAYDAPGGKHDLSQ